MSADTIDCTVLESAGIIQEANRLFFHKLGIELSINGGDSLSIWDRIETPRPTTDFRELQLREIKKNNVALIMAEVERENEKKIGELHV